MRKHQLDDGTEYCVMEPGDKISEWRIRRVYGKDSENKKGTI